MSVSDLDASAGGRPCANQSQNSLLRRSPWIQCPLLLIQAGDQIYASSSDPAVMKKQQLDFRLLNNPAVPQGMLQKQMATRSVKDCDSYESIPTMDTDEPALAVSALGLVVALVALLVAILDWHQVGREEPWNLTKVQDDIWVLDAGTTLLLSGGRQSP